MTEGDAHSDQLSRSKALKSRQRIHPSTIAFAVFLTVVLLLANVPGQRVLEPEEFYSGKYGPHFELGVHFEHGWPWTYLWREPQFTGPHQPRPWWRVTNIWALTVGVTQFSLPTFLVDILTCVALLIVTSSAFEWWRRRRSSLWQFSLRELLVVVFALILAFIWLYDNRATYRKQQQATLDLKAELGLKWQPGGPHWLRDLIGDEPFRIFDRVVSIDVDDDDIPFLDLRHLTGLKRLGGLNADPQDLMYLRYVPSLIALDLCFANFSYEDDEGWVIVPNSTKQVKYLSLLKDLEGINLYESGLTDIHLVHLQGLKRLRSLELAENPITDKGLAALAGLTNLEYLSLAATQITDQGLVYLSGLRNLQILDLGYNNHRITGAGLVHLQELSNLRELSLAQAHIEDVDLKYLGRLNHLERLDLRETKVTSAGLTHLKGLRSLEWLQLPRHGISEAAINDLKESLPNLRVDTW